MSRRCGPCGDPRRNELDRRLLEKDHTGESFRRISADFGYSETALRRHLNDHLTLDLQAVKESMQRAKDEELARIEAEERAHVIAEVTAPAVDGMCSRLSTCKGYLDQLREVQNRAAALLDQAEASEDLRAAGVFLRELREQIRLMAEMEGRLAAQPQINLQQTNIYSSPEWLAVGELLARLLAGYPDLKAALAAELAALAEGGERQG